jgi:hypothetical protein
MMEQTMITYCTTISQSWEDILSHARILWLNNPERSKTLLIQESLHMTPRQQLAWADAVWDRHTKSRDCDFYVASTCELPLLRLLRRVREKYEQTTVANAYTRAYDLTVDCCLAEGKISRLRVDTQGEFLDLWPEGFFSERTTELF